MNWFAQTFRKVHIIYASPLWAKNRGTAFNAEEYADSLAAAGVDCVELYTKDHHGICYYPCSLGLSYPHDVVGELLAAFRKRNIRLIAYFSVCFDNYALGLHPEWRAVNVWGDPCKVGPFDMACWSSGYMDFALQQIRELAQGYEVDGYWLDIMPYVRNVPQTEWMSNSLPSPCYCYSCQKGYEEETGERLPLLETPDSQVGNPLFGDLSLQHIVGQPFLAHHADQAYQFLLGKGEAFLTQAMDILRPNNPEALITYNGANSPGDPFDYADLVSIEGHAPLYTRQSFIARWGRATGKPFEVLVSAGLPGGPLGGLWCRYDHKPSPLLRMENAISLAHGGSSVLGQFPYPDGSTDSAQYRGYEQIFRPTEEIEPWLRQPQSVSDVGIPLLSKPRTASLFWYLMTEGVENIHQALLDYHYQYDILRSLDDLESYRLIVLADQAALSDAEIDRLRGYVDGGGKLLASAYSSLWDENGRRRDDFGLADLFGVSFRRDPGLPYVSIRLRDQALVDRVTSFPMFAEDAPPVEVSLNGATALGDLVYQEANRTSGTTVMWGNAPPDEDQAHPGLCRNEYGEGVCWYAAWPLRTGGLSNVWIKRLIKELVSDVVTQPVLTTTAPAGVEVVLNRQDGRHVIHFVNHHVGSPDRPSFDEENGLVLDNLEIQLDLRRLGLDSVRRVYAPPQNDLSYRVDGNYLVVQVPPLQVHSLITVE